MHHHQSMLKLSIVTLLCRTARNIRQIEAFGITSPQYHHYPARSLQRSFQIGSTADPNIDIEDVSSMKLREIQAELRDKWQVSYEDCFDRDSLTKRLVEARSGVVGNGKDSDDDMDEVNDSSASNQQIQDLDNGVREKKPSSSFNREEKLAELEKLRVAELRQELGNRNIRWANFIDKRDLVMALLDSMEQSAGFSVSGALAPGEVADLSGDELSLELSTSTDTPLLLDVYAVWCGPCQMMAPQLVEAAKELGASCRVAKMDSDKYGDWAAKLNVGGLPTIVVFDTEGKEVTRQEGAVMKDHLVNMVKPYISS